MTQDKNMIQQLLWISKIRFITASTILFVFSLAWILNWIRFPIHLFAIAPLCEMFANQQNVAYLKKHKDHLKVFYISQLVDIFMISWGIHFIGGMNMFVFVLIYPLVFIVSGIVATPAITYIMANISALAYTCIVSLEYNGILKVYNTVDAHMSGKSRLAFLLFTFVFYNLIAYFVSYLSQKLRKREKKYARSQEALQLANHRLKGIINGMTDLIAAVDVEYNYIAFNEAHKNHFKQTFGKTIAQGMSALNALEHLGDEKKRAKRLWDRALKGEDFTEIKEYFTEELGYVFYEVAYSPIKNEKDECIGATQSARIRDLTVEEELHEKLKKLLMTDELTGLYNKKGFTTLSNNLIHIAKRENRSITLVLAQFQDAEHMIEEFGEKELDDTLISISDILQQLYRQSDIIARIDPCLFAVCGITKNIDNVEIMNDRLIKILNEYNAEKKSKHPLKISLGFAYKEPHEDSVIETLLESAHKSLNQSKQEKTSDEK